MTTAAPLLDGATTRRLQATLAVTALFAAVAATVALLATAATSRASGASSPPRVPTLAAGVRVDVRGGEPYVAYSVADRLSGQGARLGTVAPAADANSVEPVTTIVYYDRRQLDAAEQIRNMLGRGTLRREQVFQPMVDVTIVLGKDLIHA
jgi:hypothetical protein